MQFWTGETELFVCVISVSTAHLGMFASPSPQDRQLAENTLDDLGAGNLKDRIYTEISGGE